MAIYINGSSLASLLSKADSAESEAMNTSKNLAEFSEEISQVSAGVTFQDTVAATLTIGSKEMERHF